MTARRTFLNKAKAITIAGSPFCRATKSYGSGKDPGSKAGKRAIFRRRNNALLLSIYRLIINDIEQNNDLNKRECRKNNILGLFIFGNAL